MGLQSLMLEVLSSDRGQKHEVWEGGVHVAGWLNGGLVPAHARGTESRALVHVTDWAPTIYHVLTHAELRCAAWPDRLTLIA